MKREYVIETREGRYVGGFVGVPARLRLVDSAEQAQLYPNRWAALEACQRGGSVLHMARIVPWTGQDAPRGQATGESARKRADAPERR